MSYNRPIDKFEFYRCIFDLVFGLEYCHDNQSDPKSKEIPISIMLVLSKTTGCLALEIKSTRPDETILLPCRPIVCIYYYDVARIHALCGLCVASDFFNQSVRYTVMEYALLVF